MQVLHSYKMKTIRLSTQTLLPIPIIVFGGYVLYSILVYLLISLYTFLALSKPVSADVLIVEGWLFEYMLDSAAKEIKKSNYKYIITTGIKEKYPKDSRYYGFESQADYCKTRLSIHGIDPSTIYALSSVGVSKNRTFHTASAIKTWLTERNISAVNVYTGGPHARKSLLLFQKALGEAIKVGVISCKIKHFDPVYWWTSWRGIQITLRYFAGYIYALLWRF